MKIYLSGAFDHADDIRVIEQTLTAAGHEVTSNWLHEPPILHSDPMHEKWEKRARANDDIADMYRSDAIAVFTQWPSTSGGRDVEKGIAITYQRFVRQDFRIMVVGPQSNVFDTLASVELYETIEEFLGAMGSRSA